MKKVSWRELPGNPFLTTAKVEMLNPKGSEVRKYHRIFKEYIVYIFDASFIYRKIFNLLEPICRHPKTGKILYQVIKDLEIELNPEGFKEENPYGNERSYYLEKPISEEVVNFEAKTQI